MDDRERIKEPKWVAAVVRAMVRRQLRRWRVQRIGQDEEDDLVNVVLMSLFCNERRVLTRFDPQRGSAARFIRVLTQRRLTDLMRKQGRRAEIDEERAAAWSEVWMNDDPESWVQTREAHEHLRRNLQKHASATDRRIFHEAFEESLSNPEIAQKLGISKSKVADRIFAVRTQAARWLGEINIRVTGRRRK